MFRPSDEAGRARAEPLRQVTTDLRAGAALLLDLQDLEFLGEPVDRQVAEVLGDAAVERNDVLRVAGNEEPRAHAVDGAVVEVREVPEPLERQVLDDVRDARNEHGLVGAPDSEHQTCLQRSLDRALGRGDRRHTIDLVPLPLHGRTIRAYAEGRSSVSRPPRSRDTDRMTERNGLGGPLYRGAWHRTRYERFPLVRL